MQRRLCPPRFSSRHGAQGIVLLALLLGLALAGVALMAAVDVWSIDRQRERESQLLFVGNQYRQALVSYYYGAPPGTPRVLPDSLEALLDDDRYPVPVHHLRRLYPDPVNGATEWGLLRSLDRIAGVYSQNDAEPLKKSGFAAAYTAFKDKRSYRDWVFAFTGPNRMPVEPPPPRAPTGGGQIHPGRGLRSDKP